MFSKQPTITAEWHVLLNEAQATCHYWLEEDLESYLVFLLMRFTSRPQFASAVLAREFLETFQLKSSLQRERMRDVADQCLLYAGLFPERAQRKRVSERYFIELGQGAYETVAGLSSVADSALFRLIAERFRLLRDVLRSMRPQYADDTPARLLNKPAQLIHH